MQHDWLSNAYLVGDEENGKAVVIDSGGPSGPLLEAADRHGLDVELLLLTHHHGDHVAENGVWKAERGVEILAHPIEAELIDDVDRTIEPGEELRVGGLDDRVAAHAGAHRRDAQLRRERRRTCSQATRSSRALSAACARPGSTSFADLRHSIMDVLMKLPHETRVHPGHTDPTTIGDEWESNAFVRLWRGLDEEGSEPCTVEGEEATLVLWAPDYDGGHKAWVRWPDGSDDIVPGSRVERG